MNSIYRFLRTRDGITRYAKVTASSEPSHTWGLSVSKALGETALLYGDAIRRAFSLVVAEREKQKGSARHVDVLEICETAVDADDGAIECAIIAAMWKSLEQDEQDLQFLFEDGKWRLKFRTP